MIKIHSLPPVNVRFFRKFAIIFILNAKSFCRKICAAFHPFDFLSSSVYFCIFYLLKFVCRKSYFNCSTSNSRSFWFLWTCRMQVRKRGGGGGGGGDLFGRGHLCKVFICVTNLRVKDIHIFVPHSLLKFHLSNVIV